MSNFITLLTLYHTIHVWQHWIFTAFDTVGDKYHFGRNQLTLFGKTFDEISKNGLFSDKLDLSDQMLKNVECLKKYVEGVKASDNATQFLDECMQEADSTCKLFANSLDDNIIATRNSARAIDQYISSQTGMTKVMNTAINIGTKLVSVAGNMLTTLAVTAAINLVVKGITWLIERQENLRQAALEAGSELDKQSAAINDYKTQISSLKESLDEGNLSEQEAYDVRKQLISIQDELVDKYGSEAAGIDLVNGKYQEQLDILNGIADQKAKDYLNEHNESINTAQEKMLEELNMQPGGFFEVSDTQAEKLQEIAAKYSDRGLSIFAGDSSLSDGTNLKDITFNIKANATDAKDVLNDFMTDVRNANDRTNFLGDDLFNTITNNLSDGVATAQSVIDTWGSEAETAAKYQIQLSDAWSKLYKNLEDAQTEYNDAVAKGNDTAISAAIEKAKAARDALNDSDSFDLYSDKDKYVKQYLDSISDQLEESTKLKAAQTAVTEALSIYTDNVNTAKNAVDSLTDAEKKYGNIDNVNRSIMTWNDDNINKWADTMATWGETFKKGEWSTVVGDAKNISDFLDVDDKHDLKIAYTAMFDDGTQLIPLTRDDFAAYLDKVVKGATDDAGNIDPDKMLKLDAKGFDTEVAGQTKHIKGMLAAVETEMLNGKKATFADILAIAGATSEELKKMGVSSEYAGKGMHQLHEQTRLAVATLEDPESFGIIEALQKYLDIDTESAKELFNTLLDGASKFSGLDDIDLANIGSLENANSRAQAVKDYTDTAVNAYDQMKDAADSLGISMSDLIDVLVETGFVTGESIKYTNEFTTNALSAATNATKAISLVTAAMQSQSTTAGVSSDSYSELIKEQGEYAAALDFENGYVKLNTDMAKKITQAKIDEAEANIKLAYSQNQMKYSQVKADLEALNTAVQQNGELEGENAEQVEKARSELEAQSKQLRENCRNLQMQYSLLVQNSGAYQDWVNAQNASEAGDMYDSIINAKKAIAEGLKNGKIGTEKFKAAVELTIPEDYQGDIAKYMKRLNRYFKQASDGSADASGLNNFLKDSIKAGLMSKDAKDQITIAANKTTKDFADALHLSMEDVQSIWGELQEYGWQFDWGSLLGNPVDNLRMQIDDIQDQMDALGDDAENSPVWQALNEQLTDLKEKLKETFSSADASQIDQSIEEIIEEAKKANGQLTDSQADELYAMGRVQNMYDLKEAQDKLTEAQKKYNDAVQSGTDYSAMSGVATELQNAQDQVTKLTQAKEKLGEPTTIEIQTFAVKYAAGEIDGIQHDAKETTEMLANIGCSVDTTQAQSDIETQNQMADEFRNKLDNVPVTLDTSTCETKISTVSKALDGLKKDIPVTLNFGIKGTLITGIANGLSYSKGGGSSKTKGTGHAAGTPNAPGGKTLVGEIGNELIVNPNTGKWYTVGDNGAEFVNLPHGAIVFDHEKTQRLLKNGFVGGYGDALVSGNAMGAGSPGVGSFVGTAGNNYMPDKNTQVKSTYKATKASTKATKDNSKALEENKKALEKQKTALEKQKTALEKESNKLKIYGQAAIDEIEKREKAINKEKDAKDKAWDAEKKQLEDKKQALQDANDEEDRAIKLAELRDALAKAKANRTVRIYNENQGFIWAADQEAVNDAQTSLDDQQRDWRREDAIKAVEDEIDKIDELKDAYAEQIDAEIKKLDDLKDKWNDVMGLIGTSWDDYQAQLAAAAHFNDMTFDGMTGDLVGYKDDVLANMKEIGGVTDQIDSITESIEKLEEAISDAKDAANGSGGGTTDPSSAFGSLGDSGIDIGDTDDAVDVDSTSSTDVFGRLRDSIAEASDAVKEYKSTEQELYEQLLDTNLTGIERIKVLNDYKDVQNDIAETQPLLTGYIREYIDALKNDTEATEEDKVARMQALTDLGAKHSEVYSQVKQTMADYISDVYNNTELTNEQRQAEIDKITELTDYASTTGDVMRTVFSDNLAAIEENTNLSNEMRQSQIDSLVQFVSQYQLSEDSIALSLADMSTQLQEAGMTAEEAHAIMMNAAQTACTSMNASYDSVITKIAALKKAQEELAAMPHVQTERGEQIVSAGKGYAGRMPEYAAGVLNAATTHIAITDEKGPEIKMRKPSAGNYSLIEKGTSVIPADASASIWKFGLDPESFIAAHMPQRSIKSVEITQPNVGSGVTVSVGDIQMYGVNDVESFGRVIHDRVSGIFAQEFSKR